MIAASRAVYEVAKCSAFSGLRDMRSITFGWMHFIALTEVLVRLHTFRSAVVGSDRNVKHIAFYCNVVLEVLTSALFGHDGVDIIYA